MGVSHPVRTIDVPILHILEHVTIHHLSVMFELWRTTLDQGTSHLKSIDRQPPRNQSFLLLKNYVRYVSNASAKTEVVCHHQINPSSDVININVTPQKSPSAKARNQ